MVNRTVYGICAKSKYIARLRVYCQVVYITARRTL